MRPIIRRTTTLAVLGAFAVASGLPAAAQDGRAQHVSQRQSILTELSPTGEPGTSRVFTQLTVQGEGEVTVALPNQSTSGLRSLDGFGGPDVNGDEVVHTLDASGQDGARARTVADNTAELPVSVSVVYRLDGQEVDADDLAGADGEVEVEYTVRNLTAEPRDIVSFDAENNRVVETMDVAVPMVGSLSLTLPPQFANIDAPGAVTAGDGRGNTVVNYSLLLFAPLGSEEQVVSWSADAVDTIIPDTSLQVLPVDDRSFTSLDATAEAYKGATGSLTDLANGALIINSNLLLLASGAGDLLDGLGQLSDGASALNDGLANTAAPGAQQLSDGLSQARAGGGELASGLGELAAGATRLSDGLGSARDGGGQLSSGLGQLAAGATRLSDGLGSARTGGGELSSGLGDLALGATRLSVGLGDARTGSAQLAGGLQALSAGAVTLSTGLGSAATGAETLATGLQDRAAPGAVQIRDGLTRVLAGIGGEPDTPADGTILGGLNGLIAGTDGLLAGLKPDADPTTSTLGDGTGALAMLTAGLRGSFGPDENGLDAGERAQAAADGLGSATQLIDTIRGQTGVPVPNAFDYSEVRDQIICLAPACAASATVDELLTTGKPELGIQTGVLGILGLVQSGLQGNADDLGDLPDTCQEAIQHVSTTPDPDGLAVIVAASCIAQNVDDGLNNEVIPGIEGQLLPGLRLVRGGVSNPAALDPANPGYNPTCTGTPEDGFQPCGIRQALQLLSAGSSDLADGLADAADGSGALVDGIRQLEAGGGQLAAGAGQASAGSSALLAGLVQLDDGAGQLADGAGRASAGSRSLVDGLRQLEDGGAQLATGAGQASAGSSALVDGLVQLDDGAGELAAGAGRASSGAGDLAAGLVQLDDGAGQLAAGLGDAADGSGQIADGLDAAAEGGGRLADGTVALQEGFEEQLIGGVSAGRQGASQDYEQVRAVIQRGKDGAAPYGVAAGADATTVFQFDLAGVGNEEGPSTGLLAGLAVLALAAVGGLGFALRRTMG